MQERESLENQWNSRACPWRLHHAFAITGQGVALGADTLIAPAVKDAYGRATLAIDGNEERIVALLSVAHGKPVSPLVIRNFHAASRALAKGDRSLALICLAQSGLPALEGWNRDRDPDLAAKALFQADRLMRWGVDPAEMLKSLGLLPEVLSLSDWRKLAKYNPNHVPAGSPEGGQFCSADEAGDAGTVTAPIPDDDDDPADQPYQVAANDTGTRTDASVTDQVAQGGSGASVVQAKGGVVVIDHGDGTTETREGGSRAWRNYNPGNLKGPFADRHGAIGSDSEGFAVFPDEETGNAAMIDLLQSPSYSYRTVDGAIERRSPPGRNNTAEIQRQVRNLTGLQGDTVVGTLDQQSLERLGNAIRRTEGWREGKITRHEKK